MRRLDPLDLDDAVVLFASRARDSSADFVLDGDSAPSVMNICSRVDRLPLAIELAAARTRAFSVQQLSKLLRKRFELVSSAAVGRPARQQTLRAAVESSHDLLVEDERRLFRRLSAFAGGFTLPAAIRVCFDDTLRAEVVDVVLAALVDKSLVVGRGPLGAPERFHMLKSVADYAADRLQESGDAGNRRTFTDSRRS